MPVATSDIPPTDGGDELTTIHVPRRHLSRVEDALATFAYRLVDDDGRLTVATIVRPAVVHPKVAQGTAFHRMSSANPSDEEIVTAFRECSGIAGERLLDDRTRKGIGAVERVHTSLTVLHGVQAERDA